VGREEPGNSTGDIREWLEGLRGKDLPDSELEAAVQRLLAAGESAMPALLEQFKTEDEALLAVATLTFKAWEHPDPVKPLLDLLKNPEVGDLAKALILNVLEHRGLDVDDPAVFGLAINLEEYIEDSGRGGNGKMQEP
jgi:hypothetical protein